MNEKICKNCSQKFAIYPDDETFYQKIDVPNPTLCPECRYSRRLVDRNEWSLYKRKCDFTGENIISIYRPDAPFPVYKPEVWRGDSWDSLAYGRDFDFNRTFFEQYEDLRQVVPHLALVAFNSVNSEYTNQSQYNKDCYMVSATGSSEKCLYGNWYQDHCYFSGDCSILGKSEYCYGCLNCWRCSRCVWCGDCFDSIDLYFCRDCHGCTSCFGSIGLRNKQNVWFGEQLSKEEYQKRFSEFDLSRENVTVALERSKEVFLKFPQKHYHGTKAFDSNGDYMTNLQNSRLNFNCDKTKDTAYLQDAGEVNGGLDLTEVLTVENSYELQGCATISNSIALRSCWVMANCFYCDMSFSCSNCFGCFGLKQKEYCILNKQYSKEEYLELKKKIIDHMKSTGEWGEYFPPETSPFAYNESVAQIYFSLTKDKALKAGFTWYEETGKNYVIDIEAQDLPAKISETKDEILKKVIGCISQKTEKSREAHPMCATAFRIHPLELQLNRKLNIPLPQECFPCRRTDRFAKRNPRRLWDGKCACKGAGEIRDYKNHSIHFHGSDSCPNKFQTSYAPDRPEIVYCEQCYQAEVA